MRLNKYIAALNIASRREADKLIKDGKVKVNGEIIDSPAIQVDERDEVICDVENYKSEKIYIKLNKPVGYVVSNNKKEGKPIYKLLSEELKNLYSSTSGARKLAIMSILKERGLIQ